MPGNLTHFIEGYTILEKLGEGGTGMVYKAMDDRLQRHVAIKFLYHQDQQNSPNSHQLAGQQLLAEAQKLAKVNHPNVVQIYELRDYQRPTSAVASEHDIVEKHSGNANSAIIMEYLNGSTLTQLNKEELLSKGQKLDILIQICAGMAAIHQQGIIHGDLKAENVWVTDSGAIKLLDFGLSLDNDRAPSESDNSATPRSASLTTLTPEFCREQPLTTQSDIFVFGCLACKLLFGDLPFRTSTIEQQFSALLTGEIKKIADVAPTLPVALAQLLDTCLAVSPDKRPSDFNDINIQLRTIQQRLFRDSHAENVTIPFEEIRSESNQDRRRKTVELSFGLSLLLLIGIFLFQMKKAPAPPEDLNVLILPPQISDESLLPGHKTRMVKAAIDTTLRDTIINIKSLNLISRSELQGVGSDLKSQVDATGADILLIPLLDCRAANCNVVLEKIAGPNNIVTQQMTWTTPTQGPLEIAQTTRSKLQSLFPERATKHLLQKAISSADFATYISLYSEIHFRSGNTVESFNQLTQLLENQPHLYTGYRLHQETALKLYLDTGDKIYLEQLRKMLDRAPYEYRQSVHYLRDEFTLSLYLADMEEAETLLQRMTLLGLEKSALIELEAAMHLENNQPQQAKQLLIDVLQIRYNARSLYNLALSHWYLGESEEAINRLLDLVKISPLDYPAQQLLAAFYLHKGELDETISLYEVLITHNPESRDLSNLSLAFLLKGDLDNARLYASQAVYQSPDNYGWRLNLADIEKLAGNHDEANHHYHQILENLGDKQDLDSLLIMAQAYIHSGDGISAIKALNNANKLSPDNSEVAFISAIIYSIQGEYASAIVKSEEALSTGQGVIWFNLPWFKPLCSFQQFLRLIEAYQIDGNSVCIL